MRAKSRREVLSDRPWRKVDSQDKPGHPLSLRATRDSRCGRPCFYRSEMLSQVDISLVPKRVPSGARQSVASTNRAVFAPPACNRSRKFRPRRVRINVVSNVASTDAKKARPHLVQKESMAWSSRYVPAETSSVNHDNQTSRQCFRASAFASHQNSNGKRS